MENIELDKAIKAYYENDNPETENQLTSLLRNSTFSIPYLYDDNEAVLEMLKNGQFDPEYENLLTQYWDILENTEGERFLPLFTNDEELEKHDDSFVYENVPMIDAMLIAYDIENLKGIVVNPYGKQIIIGKELFSHIASFPADKEDDPLIQLENAGIAAYELNTPEGFQEAEKYFLQAAKLDSTCALCNLGYIYAYNRVEGSTKEKGYECFEKAASLGEINSMIKIADDYRYGDFHDKDEEKAFGLYFDILKIVEDQYNYEDYPGLLLRIADCLYHGIGAIVDYKNAYTFADLAVQIFESRQDLFYYRTQVVKARELRSKSLEMMTS